MPNPARPPLWWILLTGLILLSLLIAVGYLHPNLTERVKFVTVNALSVFVFLAIVVQAYIYQKQWELMEQQSATMKDSLKALEMQGSVMRGQLEAMGSSLMETRKLVDQNERAVKAAEDSVEIAHRAYVLLSRAFANFTDYTHVSHVSVNYEIKNFGNTPASDVRISRRAEVCAGEPDVDDSTIDWTERDSIVIAPQAPFDEVLDTIHIDLKVREQMGHGKPLNLYLWRMIRYKDIFGIERSSSFCWVMSVGKGSQFRPCGRGNQSN